MNKDINMIEKSTEGDGIKKTSFTDKLETIPSFGTLDKNVLNRPRTSALEKLPFLQSRKLAKVLPLQDSEQQFLESISRKNSEIDEDDETLMNIILAKKNRSSGDLPGFISSKGPISQNTSNLDFADFFKDISLNNLKYPSILDAFTGSSNGNFAIPMKQWKVRVYDYTSIFVPLKNSNIYGERMSLVPVSIVANDIQKPVVHETSEYTTVLVQSSMTGQDILADILSKVLIDTPVDSSQWELLLCHIEDDGSGEKCVLGRTSSQYQRESSSQSGCSSPSVTSEDGEFGAKSSILERNARRRSSYSKNFSGVFPEAQASQRSSEFSPKLQKLESEEDGFCFYFDYDNYQHIFMDDSKLELDISDESSNQNNFGKIPSSFSASDFSPECIEPINLSVNMGHLLMSCPENLIPAFGIRRVESKVDSNEININSVGFIQHNADSPNSSGKHHHDQTGGSNSGSSRKNPSSKDFRQKSTNDSESSSTTFARYRQSLAANSSQTEITPCYVYKLNSTYPKSLLEKSKDGSSDDSAPLQIHSKHWDRRFMCLSKYRYLIFFKSEWHSRWVQNVLHEIDLWKVREVKSAGEDVWLVGSSVDKNGDLPKKAITSNKSGENHSFGLLGVDDPNKHTIKIWTRTRQIVLCADNVEEKERILRELKSIISSFSSFKASLKVGESTGVSTSRTKRSKSPTSPLVENINFADLMEKSFESNNQEGNTAPVDRIIGNLSRTKNFNNIDLPPFDYKNEVEELLGWAIEYNDHVARIVKDICIVKLRSMSDIFSKDVIDNLKSDRTQTQNELEPKKRSGESGNPTLATLTNNMKKLWKWTDSKSRKQSSNTTPYGSLDSVTPASASGSLGNLISTPLTGYGNSNQIFGVDLQELSDRYDSTSLGIPTIPPIVEMSMNFIIEKGLNVSGIFRMAGSFKRMELLKDDFEKYDYTRYSEIRSAQNTASTLESPTSADAFDFGPYNVHDVAGVLKLFFRALPEPLLKSQHYHAFINIESHEFTSNEVSKFQVVQYLIMTLPAINRHLLEVFLKFLKKISDESEDEGTHKGNLMSSSNLATVLAPNILNPQNAGNKKENADLMLTGMGIVGGVNADSQKVALEVKESSLAINIFKYMIDHAESLFILRDELISEIRTAAKSPINVAQLFDMIE